MFCTQQISKMSNLTKLEREMKSIFQKTSDGINLVMATEMEGKLINRFKDRLTYLNIIKKEIEKLENSKRLETDKIKGMTRKELKELKAQKFDELQWLDNRLRFERIKNRFLGKDNIEGETELRKIRNKRHKRNTNTGNRI